MNFDQVKIIITNGDGDVFAIHQIADQETARHFLHNVAPHIYECPNSEPENDKYFDVVNDLITAARNLIDQPN